MDSALGAVQCHAYYRHIGNPSVKRMDTRQSRPASAQRALRIAITGGTSGLGRALVQELSERGADVAFIARDAARVARVAREVPGTLGISGDVADSAAIHRLALQILGWRGGLDALVNNASSLGPVPLVPLADTPCEAFEAAVATNLLGPFRLTRALLGALAASAREGRGAVVVNVTSDAAVTPYANWGAYGASKVALLQMTRIWGEECAALGVRFLAIDPGDMDTPLHALALPDADRTTLRTAANAARDVANAIEREVVRTADRRC
jgi:NAD(P)-dependent dehydrogenase (short-subunit alcohol dehydrogenase family)